MRFTMLSRMMRRLLVNILLFPVFLGLAVEGGEPAATDPPTPPPSDPPADPPAEPSIDDDPAAQAAAEEARRAALTDDERAAEDQAKAEADKKLEGAPEEYTDFKFPEKMEFDKAMMDEFKPLLKDQLNLSQDKAQELIDFYTQKVVPSFHAKGIAVWNADVEARQTAIANDKEIGGDKLKITTETVNRVVNSFLNAEESQELMQYSDRFGDCPAILKLWSRIGAAMGEGKIVTGGAGDSPDKSLADRMFGKSE